MKSKHVLYAALIVFLVQSYDSPKIHAQYFFERHTDSYVRVDDKMSARVDGFNVQNTTDPDDYIELLEEEVPGSVDLNISDTGNQSVIASSITSASASAGQIGFVTAESNTQMSFNPDHIANGQVSTLAINTVIAAIDNGPYTADVGGVSSISSYSKASCSAKFTLLNSQPSPPPTQVKLKIRLSSSFTADPAFQWSPEHSFAIYKNNSGTPMLASSTSGEVTYTDPSASPNDSYRIVGYVNAKGGVGKGYFPLDIDTITLLGGSLHVTGEAEVSIVP